MTTNTIFTAIITGTLLGVLANLLNWLIGGETSPFHEYFLQNVGLKNWWMMLNFPSYMGLLLTGGRSFGAGFFFVFMQWFVIGFGGLLVLSWISKPHETLTEQSTERVPPSKRAR